MAASRSRSGSKTTTPVASSNIPKIINFAEPQPPIQLLNVQSDEDDESFPTPIRSSAGRSPGKSQPRQKFLNQSGSPGKIKHNDDSDKKLDISNKLQEILSSPEKTVPPVKSFKQFLEDRDKSDKKIDGVEESLPNEIYN